LLSFEIKRFLIKKQKRYQNQKLAEIPFVSIPIGVATGFKIF